MSSGLFYLPGCESSLLENCNEPSALPHNNLFCVFENAVQIYWKIPSWKWLKAPERHTNSVEQGYSTGRLFNFTKLKSVFYW